MTEESEIQEDIESEIQSTTLKRRINSYRVEIYLASTKESKFLPGSYL